MEYITNEMTLEIKQKIIAKIMENDFEYENDFSYMYVNIDNKKFRLSNDDVYILTMLTIEQRVNKMNGISAREFAKEKGTHIGYKIFDKSSRNDFFDGNYVEGESKYGLYFTIKKEELFQFVMLSYLENFGDTIAKVSLQKPDGAYIENAAIRKGPDTENTYSSQGLYILETYSLNDYDLLINLYSIADDEHKLMAFDDTSGGHYKQSIEYFNNKNCKEAVRALEDIHKMEIKRKRTFC